MNAPRSTSAATMPERFLRDIAIDVIVNTAVPTALYYVATRAFSLSELSALLIAAAFPIGKSIFDFSRKRMFDPITILILFGIAVSLVALALGGGPQMLLIRESFSTVAFGIACIVSLGLPRPMMFYFGRHFFAMEDAERRALYDTKWAVPLFRTKQRVVTAVWGAAYIAEFIAKIAIVRALSPGLVLAASPLLSNGTTVLLILWTFRYAKQK